jgi:dihydropteroate synthase
MEIPYVLSHIQGTPSTMQSKTHYTNLIQDILYYFSERVQYLRDLGQKDIIIDPGFGFGKTTEQNYELLSRLDELQIFELPILAGISRKSMIFKILGCSPEESLNGTTSLNMICLMKGSNILRVHDVKACKEVIRLYTEFSVYDKNFEYNKRISRYEKC